MTSPAALQRFDERFVKVPSNSTKSGFQLICDPEFAKAFLVEELYRREAEVLEQIEEISEFLSEDSLQRVLMHYKMDALQKRK